MYRAVALIICLLSAAVSSVALSQKGLVIEHISHLDSVFQVLRVDLRSYRLELHWQDEEGKPLGTFANLAQYFKRRHRPLLFATNAGIYDPGLVPHGLHVQDGQELVRINRKGTMCSQTSNFHMKPNGIFLIARDGAQVIRTEAYDGIRIRPFLATQSGPLLVINNQVNPCFRKDSQSRYVRNGIGVRDENVYIVITEAPVNLYTIASFFKDVLQCRDALYLDGSISSICQDCARDERFSYAGMLAVTAMTQR